MSVDARGAYEIGAHPIGGGHSLLSRGALGAFLTCTPGSPDQICSKNNAPEGFIPFGLRLIFFFCETLK